MRRFPELYGPDHRDRPRVRHDVVGIRGRDAGVWRTLPGGARVVVRLQGEVHAVELRGLVRLVERELHGVPQRRRGLRVQAAEWQVHGDRPLTGRQAGRRTEGQCGARGDDDEDRGCPTTQERRRRRGRRGRLAGVQARSPSATASTE